MLERSGAPAGTWPAGYLLSANALLAGDIERAIRYRRTLPPPDDPGWQGLDRWLTGAVQRLEPLRRGNGPHARDLRGWHFVLNGGVLATLSPFGYDEGMNGRFAWAQVSPPSLRSGLARIRLALAAAGRRPAAVGLLPSCSDRRSPRPGRSDSSPTRTASAGHPRTAGLPTSSPQSSPRPSPSPSPTSRTLRARPTATTY